MKIEPSTIIGAVGAGLLGFALSQIVGVILAILLGVGFVLFFTGLAMKIKEK